MIFIRRMLGLAVFFSQNDLLVPPGSYDIQYGSPRYLGVLAGRTSGVHGLPDLTDFWFRLTYVPGPVCKAFNEITIGDDVIVDFATYRSSGYNGYYPDAVCVSSGSTYAVFYFFAYE